MAFAMALWIGGEIDMNRQQRRAAKMGHSDPARMMRQSDIDRIRQQAQVDAASESMAMLFSLVIEVMHSQYGWGKKRLGDLCEALVDEYNTFDESKMSLEDYQEYVYQMTGVKFKAM